MDYDAYDAILHHVFKQTQGDAWFKPSEENLAVGVCLRVEPGHFRVFPYENHFLVPFESAVRILNPVVAVKVRSAAVHAALALVPEEDRHIYVDKDTRIQILDTMARLPRADKEQCAAFIRDERVLVVWADNLEHIIPFCRDFEDKLIKLVWRSRPALSSGLSTATSGSIGSFTNSAFPSNAPSYSALPLTAGNGGITSSTVEIDEKDTGEDPEKGDIIGEDGVTISTSLAAPTRVGRKDKMSAQSMSKKWKSLFGWRATKNSVVAKHKEKDLEQGTGGKSKRPIRLFAPVYGGLGAGLSLFFIGSGINTLVSEWLLDGSTVRFALLVTAPFLFCVSLFFAVQIITNISFVIGPVAQYHENSKYYSAIPPSPNRDVDDKLPHVTIQMPVYKESLEQTITPSVESLKKAMQTYARQGGTSSIFVNDDGLQILSDADREARIEFYANHGIGWVARPKHGSKPDALRGDVVERYKASLPLSSLSEKEKEKDGDVDTDRSVVDLEHLERGEETYERKGRFKKASNMNYGLALSLRVERCLKRLVEERERRDRERAGRSSGVGVEGVPITTNDGEDIVVIPAVVPPTPTSSAPLHGRFSTSSSTGNVATPASEYSSSPFAPYDSSPLAGDDNEGGVSYNRDVHAEYDEDDEEEEYEDLEEKALQLALEETYAETGWRFRPWARNAKSIRMGEVVLIVDSDTIVPEDCLRDAARELAECPEVAIIQHESDVMQVAHHYFENGIAHFTRRINKCISIACANGEVAPFVGHNAFLRWSAIQDAAFVDELDGVRKIWSEANVSEDFDMALRLQLKGYIIRWASYSNGGFKEGVSLTCDDELNRWQKYAYGCNELLFNPIIQWWRKGPINKQLQVFIWSDAPIHYKISMLSYMFSYYGLAGALTLSVINYILLGFALTIDGFYEHSFEIWLACTVVFPGAGNLGFTLLEYRLGTRSLMDALIENVTWIPFFFFFFGGLSIHLSQALLAHLFSYNITWGATKKEVERSNFFIEVPRILRRFWLSFVVCGLLVVVMVILTTPLTPIGWRVDGTDWAVIFPLAIVVGCHILYPIILNPWLMIFSY